MLGGLFRRKKRNSELETLFGPYVPRDVLAVMQDLPHFDLWPIEFIFVARQTLTDHLATALGKRAKLIHGHRQARVGDLGSGARRSYGVLIPDQLDLLAALHQAPWGVAAA